MKNSPCMGWEKGKEEEGITRFEANQQLTKWYANK